MMRYLANCTELEGPDVDALNAMTKKAEPISYHRMLKLVGAPFHDWQANLGYRTPTRNRDGLVMRHDYHVGYFKSTWRSLACCYFVWSAIEYIFVEVRDAG